MYLVVLVSGRPLRLSSRSSLANACASLNSLRSQVEAKGVRTT